MKKAIPLPEVVASTLSQMGVYLQTLDDDRYREPLELFSQSTIGQHTRHVVEFLQCLLFQAECGVINYEHRQRNHQIETETGIAWTEINAIVSRLHNDVLPDKLELETQYGPAEESPHKVPTTFERELIYNIEHAIHHLAIIKIGLKVIAPEIELPRSFGVAPSTIRFREQQAQPSASSS
ncbi:MAG: hypothetical protein AAF399_09550 [Bacteroidota bacterium]